MECAARELALCDDIGDVICTLSRLGYSIPEADRAVLLVPSAFAREVFEPEGIAFSDTFFTPSGNTATDTRAYADEPIYLEARLIARRWLAESRSSLVQRVLDWSAEAKGIREARAKGLTPTFSGPITHEF